MNRSETLPVGRPSTAADTPRRLAPAVLAWAAWCVLATAGPVGAQEATDDAERARDEATVTRSDAGRSVPQEVPDAQDLAASPDDPPARVGRLAELRGEVYLYDEQAGEWRTADRNRPVTTGDRLSTGADGRAEVQVGTTAWRLGPRTELEVLRLDDHHVQLQLHSGSVALRVRNRLAATEAELRTGEGRFLPRLAGHYRLDREDDVSIAGVWSGELRYETAGTQNQALPVAAGERRRFWLEAGPDSPARHELATLERDEFADWVLAAEARDERSASTRYVSPEMTGAGDLDRYGRWETHAEYGPIWAPHSVAPGWAPYRYGRWVWVSPWGWTWVDDAPWGFAPFHYGRWVMVGSRWCWTPGRDVWRPVYAPALVAWIGGPRVSVSIGVGGPPAVGWFPLGPREVYVPGYRYSPRYLYVVNGPRRLPRDHVHRIVRDPDDYVMGSSYRYRGRRDAETRVPGDVLIGHRPVAPAWQRGLDPSAERELERPRVRPSPALPTPVVSRDRPRPGAALPRPPWENPDGRREGRRDGGDSRGERDSVGGRRGDDWRDGGRRDDDRREGRIDDGRVGSPPRFDDSRRDDDRAPGRPRDERDGARPVAPLPPPVVRPGQDTRPVWGRPGDSRAEPGRPDEGRRPGRIDDGDRGGSRPSDPGRRPGFDERPRPAPAPDVRPPAMPQRPPAVAEPRRPEPPRDTRPGPGDMRGALPGGNGMRPPGFDRPELRAPAPAPRREMPDGRAQPRNEPSRGARSGGPGADVR